MREADDYSSMLRFLAFPNTMEPAFSTLLRAREPRALLLMAIWYELVPPSFWWISLRVSLERQSIWTYLGWYHANKEPIRSFLAAYSPQDLCPGQNSAQSTWQINLTARFDELKIADG